MTELKYFENTYLFEHKSQITNFGENEFGQYIILDSTIFYPQGGGQPSDTGEIIGENFRFEVKKGVFINEEVYHYGVYLEGRPVKGVQVTMHIDQENRKLNARNHTAGHLIDVALNELNLHLQPIKGYHYPQGAYVEYEGNLENSPEIISQIENELKTIIESNPKIWFEFKSGEKHESGKPTRIMHIEGFDECPCGGTHVDTLKKIGEIKIRKIKNSSNILRISYQVI